MEEELTVDEFIRGRMKKVVDSNIETMVESKAKSFVNELRKRYDMAFAAFIVDNMRKQNMLKDEKIAELLKDNRSESKNPLPFKKQWWYGYRKRRNMYYSQKL